MQATAGVEHPEMVFQDVRVAEDRRAPSPQVQEELIGRGAHGHGHPATAQGGGPQQRGHMGSGGGGWLRHLGTQAASGRSRHEVLDAFILGFARFQVGCSAHFNDLQHVHPKDLIHTSNTVELKAWQTKTVSAARSNRNRPP